MWSSDELYPTHKIPQVPFLLAQSRGRLDSGRALRMPLKVCCNHLGFQDVGQCTRAEAQQHTRWERVISGARLTPRHRKERHNLFKARHVRHARPSSESQSCRRCW